MRRARRPFVASVGEQHASVAPDEVGPPPLIRAVMGVAVGVAAGVFAASSLSRPSRSEPVSCQPEPPGP
ncbi:MAG: hypothetical protein ACR2MA_11295 [Egibacteraceae bacterium]